RPSRGLARCCVCRRAGSGCSGGGRLVGRTPFPTTLLPLLPPVRGLVVPRVAVPSLLIARLLRAACPDRTVGCIRMGGASRLPDRCQGHAGRHSAQPCEARGLGAAVGGGTGRFRTRARQGDRVLDG